MNGIVEMLRKNRKIVYDLHLSWGARLSSYTYVLNSEDTFVGVKLTDGRFYSFIYTIPHIKKQSAYNLLNIELVIVKLANKNLRIWELVFLDLIPITVNGNTS